MNRLLLTLGLAAMDACWVVPWAILLGLWTDPARPRALLSASTVLALVVLGALATQTLGRWAVHGRSARYAVVGLGGLAVLLAVRLDQYADAPGLDWLAWLAGAVANLIGQPSAPSLAFGLGLFVWWRGVRVGTQTPSFSDVESVFRWGIGLLVSFALLLATATRPALLHSVEAQTTPFVVGFFFVSLLTLALGRLESLRTRTRALAVNSQWISVLVVVSGLVILAALIVGQLLSFDLLILATRPLFDLLGQLVLLVIYLVVIPLAYVVEWLVYLLLSLLQSGTGTVPPQLLQPADVDARLRRLLAQELPPELLSALRTVGAVLLLVVGLLVVARAASRWRRASLDQDANAEQRDSVWEPDRLRRLLVGWWRRLFGRRRARGLTASAAVASGMLEPAEPGAQGASVRELYRLLVRLGESSGAPRAAATTPREHLPALQASLEPAADAAQLTEAYQQVRYADLEPSPSETQLAREQFARLHPRLPSQAK